MNIEEAKQIRIVDFLAELGKTPVKVRNGQYWYLSPLRDEDTPSFKVNDRMNEWYDFGIAEGGDIVELARQLYRTSDVSTALARLEQHATPQTRIRSPSVRPQPLESVMKNVTVQPLQHHALLSYLITRCVDLAAAQEHCHEVRYEVYHKHYFGIAFKNDSGGYEIRNAYFKGCIRCKDITVKSFSFGERQDSCLVFEGFMDFLSYLTLQKKGDAAICVGNPCDHIIMNSVANLRKCLEALNQYGEIHCYLDNDLAGQKTVKTIAGLYGDKVTDESVRYRDYKDLNDYIQGKKKQ